MKVPLVILVWDDGYGISVPIELQTTKASISEACAGFLVDDKGDGIHIYTAKAWDYPELVSVYDRAIAQTRKLHRPTLIHIQECTQPQGHSTSGSHERYKSKERLEWEKEFDGISKMEQWIIDQGWRSRAELDDLRKQVKAEVRAGSKKVWKQYQDGICLLYTSDAADE